MIFLLSVFPYFFSDVIDEQTIQHAIFIELHSRKNRKFGDVINWANGKFESDASGEFRIVELHENCIKRCPDEALEKNTVFAFWSVYKIRHRDETRGYRYEWKITVRAAKTSRSDRKLDDDTLSVRSFLLRDYDYPKYFLKPERINQMPGSERRMEKRIFSLYDRAEFPFRLNYQTQYPAPPVQYDQAEELNTGEYYRNGPAQQVPQQPTQQQFQQTSQQIVQIPQSSKPVRYHEYPPNHGASYNNLHHHYFLNKNEVPVFKMSHLEKVHMYPPRPGTKPYSNGFIPRHHGSVVSVQPKQLIRNYPRNPANQQTLVHFPDDQISTHSPIGPGPYDDNRESILEGEVVTENTNIPFEANANNQNLFIPFPPRSANNEILSNINATPYQYEINTSAIPAIPLFGSFIPNQPNTDAQAALNQQQLFWLRSGNPFSNNVNFIGSYPYQENTYSELDPIYHSPVVVTPVSVLPNTITDDATKAVSQLPLQNSFIENTSYGAITENHQTTVYNTEPTVTTLFDPSIAPTTLSQLNEEKSSQYPDSINAQLPPPESGTDLRVPYVDSDKRQSSRRDQSNDASKYEHVTEDKRDTSKQIKNAEIETEAPKVTTQPSRNKYRSKSNNEATEKPKPKWEPKRSRQRMPGKYKIPSHDSKTENTENRETRVNRRRSPTTRNQQTIDEVTTIYPEAVTDLESETNTLFAPTTTTTEAPSIEDEPRTAQSVRKSISVHVGGKVIVRPK